MNSGNYDINKPQDLQKFNNDWAKYVKNTPLFTMSEKQKISALAAQPGASSSGATPPAPVGTVIRYDAAGNRLP